MSRPHSYVIGKRRYGRWCWHGTANGRKVKAFEGDEYVRSSNSELNEFVRGVMVRVILAGDSCRDRRKAHEDDREVAVANASLSSLAGSTIGPLGYPDQGWSRNQRD